MFRFVAFAFSSLLFAASGSNLARQQADVFIKILKEGFGKDKVDVDGLVKLQHLMDGHPKYNLAGMQYIMEQWGYVELPFTILHEVVDKIYGDLISDDPYQPQEIHLQYTNDPTSMKVMWATMEPLEQPFVQFMSAAMDNWDLAKKLTATNYTYEVPQNWWPTFTGMLYEVDMPNLQPDHAYQYRVGGFDTANNTLRYSEAFTFRAAPVPNDPSRKTRVFSAADHGTFMFFGFETTKKMQMTMKELQADFVFVAGDLSYAGLSSAMPRLNISKEDEFEHIWDLLGIQNQPVAAYMPWMVGDGNHERFYNWSAFTNRYHMPHNPEFGSDGNFWYTFTYGNIQWVSISSEHDLSEGSPQMNFIRAALTAAVANRATVPWIILSIHKPIYCSVDGSPSYADELDAVLLEFDVDLTITGHMHAYERIHPTNQNNVMVYPTKHNMFAKLGGDECKFCRIGEVDVYESTGKGPVHVMQGHAGGMQLERWIQPPPAWSAFRMANGIVPKNQSEDTAASWMKDHKLAHDLSDDTSLTYLQLQDMPIMYGEESRIADHAGYNYSHTYGFGYITAYNATHLHYQAIPNVDGIFNHDEFWIVKQH